MNLIEKMEAARKESKYRKDCPEFRVPLRESLSFKGREVDWESTLGKELLRKLAGIPITERSEKRG